jgi:putative Mg2+ transporter-C (MgtC) family protein
MNSPLSFVEIVVRLLAAVAGGAVLGWEREAHRKPAGLRTQMMVGLGAATFTLVTLGLGHTFEAEGGAMTGGVSRMIQGIIGGIGFLGAGAIIQSRGSVQGITTAATIWVVGAMGIACGMGYYVLAGSATVLAMLILSLVGLLEMKFFKGPPADRKAAEKETEEGL